MSKHLPIVDSHIQSSIFTIRGLQVMLDRDLAQLYQVETKVLNQAVKRNAGRFPDDFMFQLSQGEFHDWKSQFVTSNGDKIGLRRPPYVFTKAGVSMLASILKSDIAVKISAQIIRVFINMRKSIANHAAVFQRMDNIEHQQHITKTRLDNIYSEYDLERLATISVLETVQRKGFV